MLFSNARQRSQQRRFAQIEVLNTRALELRQEMGLEPNSCLRVETTGLKTRVRLAPFLEGLGTGVFVTSEDLYTRVHDTAHLGHVWRAGPAIVNLALSKAPVGSRLLQAGRRREAGLVGRGLDLMLSQAVSTDVISRLLASGDQIEPPTPPDSLPEQSARIMAEQQQFLGELYEVARNRTIGLRASA